MEPHVPRVERRKSQRRTPTIRAFVHCHGLFQSTKIMDYSPEGLQVSGTFGLNVTDPVEIELMSGTRLAGRVAWSVGERTGISFLEPLEELHPALIELERAIPAVPD